MGVSLSFNQQSIDVVYNGLESVLDEKQGRFALASFVDVFELASGKGCYVTNVNGKKYFFTVNEPITNQMTMISYRGQQVPALPVSLFSGKAVTDNSELFLLMRSAIN